MGLRTDCFLKSHGLRDFKQQLHRPWEARHQARTPLSCPNLPDCSTPENPPPNLRIIKGTLGDKGLLLTDRFLDLRENCQRKRYDLSRSYVPFSQLTPNLRGELRGLAVCLVIDCRAPSSNKTCLLRIDGGCMCIAAGSRRARARGQFIFSAT